jgi:excisionase family DNA binding protein
MSDAMIDGPDWLYGAEAIAAAIGVSRRAAYHLIETGIIPAKKAGRTVCASRREVKEAFKRLPDRPLRNGHQAA